jgi:hypothetical protein
MGNGGYVVLESVHFETPFVLLRVLPLFFFLFLGIYYLLRSLINDDSTVITK